MRRCVSDTAANGNDAQVSENWAGFPSNITAMVEWAYRRRHPAAAAVAEGPAQRPAQGPGGGTPGELLHWQQAKGRGGLAVCDSRQRPDVDDGAGRHFPAQVWNAPGLPPGRYGTKTYYGRSRSCKDGKQDQFAVNATQRSSLCFLIVRPSTRSGDLGVGKRGKVPRARVGGRNRGSSLNYRLAPCLLW